MESFAGSRPRRRTSSASQSAICRPPEGAGSTRRRNEVEHHVLQGPVEILHGPDLHPEAPGGGRAVEHEREAIRAAFEISRANSLATAGSGMVDPLDDAPAARFRAPDESRPRPSDTVARCAARHKCGRRAFLEIGTLEHPLDELEPLLAGGGWKIGGEGEFGHDAA